MTGKKNVLPLINNYGHCSNSETVGMSLESICNNSDSFIPDGIKTKPKLSTRIIINITIIINFDRLSKKIN